MARTEHDFGEAEIGAGRRPPHA